MELSVRMNYALCVLLMMALGLTEGARVNNCTAETDGCVVVDGRASCNSSNLALTISALPPCVTVLDMALRGHVALLPGLFDRFPRMTVINMYARGRDTYDVTHMDILKASFTDHFFLCKSLQVLRLKVKITVINIVPNALRSLTSLVVLDLTRSRAVNFKELIGAFPESSSPPPLKKLLLKNVQEFSKLGPYSEGVNLAALACRFRTSLEVLDLSYNDLTTFYFGNPLCNFSRLRYLDLRNNFLQRAFTDESQLQTAGYPDYLITFSRIESFRIGHQWELTKYQAGLWDDDADSDVTNDSAVMTYEPQHQLIDDLITWIKSFKPHCPGINFHNIPRCALERKITDKCAFIKCLDPSLNPKRLEHCRSNFRYFFEELMQTVCDFTECIFGMPVLLPTSLKRVEVNDMNTPGSHHIIDKSFGTVLCVYDKNNLESLDLSNTDIKVGNTSLWSTLSIRGLEKLKFLSIQNCRMPFVLNYPKLFSGMPSLDELHIGGNTLAEGSGLPQNMFYDNVHLRILNLSNSGLVKIPTETFVFSGNLTLLDLSHNALTENSLNFNVSRTKLTRLNLSANAISSIPRAMRVQLEQLVPLQLDLSANPLQCGCHDIDFVQWIQTVNKEAQQINFTHGHDYTCLSNSQTNWILSMNIAQLRRECSQWRVPVIASASTLGVVLLLGMIILLHRKRWVVRHFLFELRERYEAIGSDVIVPDYSYDAFVLYSSVDDDRTWVQIKLVKELENNFGFRLCIHHRDFIGGVDIADNIEMGIRNSRKVIAILSPDFLSSNYGTTEISMTCSVDPGKLVLVMYRDLARDTYIPAMLRHLLETRTYIEYDPDPTAQTLFWKRLYKALYTKSRPLPQ